MSTSSDINSDIEPAGPAGPTEVEPAKPTGDPTPDPGFPDHGLRLTDVDEKAQKRAERQVAGMFGLASLLIVGFVVAYLIFTIQPAEGEAVNVGDVQISNLTLGVTLGLALLLIGTGSVQWARSLMTSPEVVHERYELRSADEVRESALSDFETGVEETGIRRRKLIRNTLLGSLALLPIPAVILLRDLGPQPGNAKAHTIWAEGVRVLTDVTFEPITAAQMEVGQLVNAMPESFLDEEIVPEHGPERINQRAKVPIIVIRMRPEEITPGEGREDWDVDGIMAYSKICTHVGCPISLYEQTTHHMLCPCHQSTFDLAEAGKVIFGPARRSLPQLPLAVDDEGYLVAQSDFTEPVGPSYWERG